MTLLLRKWLDMMSLPDQGSYILRNSCAVIIKKAGENIYVWHCAYSFVLTYTTWQSQISISGWKIQYSVYKIFVDRLIIYLSAGTRLRISIWLCKSDVF